MTWILNIESTTNKGEVSLTKDGELIEISSSNEEGSFSESITNQIQKLCNNNGISISDLSTVAVSMGPGSYTSLRIGLSVAKGICFGIGIPLIGIPTLDLLVNEAITKSNIDNALYIGMIDARRMDVYTSIYNNRKEIILPESFVTVNEAWFDQWTEHTTIVCGDGAKKIKNLSKHYENLLELNIEQSASLMTGLSYQYFQEKRFIDLANSIPNYLKPPNITSKKHIIN